ncbi:P-loop containing nucleoside triphosphate hydrolase protein [Suillus cothurnatus]|nr:P-loop containing nucleoside triphosphate hydrolase protein [Suillus cothurnatus]
MSFWMPLLFKPGIQIIVTPLNQLGKQNVDSLAKAGMQSIAISAETATWSNFRDIEDMKYCAVIISPEQLMKPGGEFEKMLHKLEFASRVIGIVFDEAHCITSWGDFHPEYKELQRLRYILPCYIPFMIASTTLTPHDLAHVKRRLRMRTENLVTIQMSVDRSNIKLCVRKIKYTLSSYQDLAFLIPDGWNIGDPSPPKFLVFFDDIQQAIAAAKTLQDQLPFDMRNKIKWFNSDMTTEYKENELTCLISGETWGLCTTESFGMGMDVPDIKIVVQWRATCKLSTLWQRWGHAARDRELQGTAILFAEKEHFDDVREERCLRQESRKQKQQDQANLVTGSTPLSKRQRVVHATVSSQLNKSPTFEEDNKDLEENGNLECGKNSGSQGVVMGTNCGKVGVLGEDEQLREMLQSKEEAKTASWTARKKPRELDPAMDCLINAHLRSAIQCQ